MNVAFGGAGFFAGSTSGSVIAGKESGVIALLLNSIRCIGFVIHEGRPG
jgi:hypothetical protein